MYPCTSDKKKWSNNTSVRNLFGEYCLGDIFAYDQMMEKLQNSKSEFQSRKRPREAAKPSSPTLSEEGSLDVRVKDNEDRLINLVRPSAAEKGHSVPRGGHLLASSANRNEEGLFRNTVDTSRASEISLLNTGIYKLRGSFLERIADARQQDSRSRSPTEVGVCGDGAFSQDGPHQISKLDQKGKISGKLPQGNEVEPIELSDEDDAISETTAQGGPFLLRGMPEPNSLRESSDNLSQNTSDTQLSLSDAVFESQTSRPSAAEDRVTKTQHRKEAYKAPKEISDSKEGQGSLVSSGGNHGEEETEL